MRDNLITAREALSLSTQEVAEMIGVKPRMYQYMEAGERTGRYELWQKLEVILNTDQDTLRINTPTLSHDTQG